MLKNPLIRKHYSPLIILKSIIDKIFRIPPKPLNIPSCGENAQFVTLIESAVRKTLPTTTPPRQFIRILKNSGLRGLGGGGFPTAQKLETILQADRKQPVLIINAVECDPGLHHDRWILAHKTPELEELIVWLRTSLNLESVFLARKAGGEDLKGVETIEIPDYYPAGEERSLVRYILGKENDTSRYPAEKGIWVQNIQTLLAIHTLLCEEAPVRYLTLCNLDEKKVNVLECPAGISVREISDRYFPKHKDLFYGGGILQAAPLEKEMVLSAEIQLIAAGTPAAFPDQNCRQCGQCSRFCPAEINIQSWVRAVGNGETVPTEEKERCMKCGTCTYLCPSGRKPHHLFA